MFQPSPSDIPDGRTASSAKRAYSGPKGGDSDEGARRMSLDLFFSFLALGSAYAMAAAGFVLILNATASVNFAQGDLVTAGGYGAIGLTALLPALGWTEDAAPGVVMLPLVMLAGAGLGLLLSATAYFPLAARPPTAVFVSTIAIGIMLQNAYLRLGGPEAQAGPALLPADMGSLVVSALGVSAQDLAVIATAAVAIAGLYALLHRTQFGRRMRAAAADPAMARALGIRVGRVSMVAFVLSGALAAVAGLLLSHRYFVAPGDGSALMLKAYIAVTLGGWGRLSGAVIGAFLVAAIEIGVARFAGFPMAEVVLFTTALIVLLIRPKGLLGEAEGRRA